MLSHHKEPFMVLLYLLVMAIEIQDSLCRKWECLQMDLISRGVSLVRLPTSGSCSKTLDNDVLAFEPFSPKPLNNGCWSPRIIKMFCAEVRQHISPYYAGFRDG